MFLCPAVVLILGLSVVWDQFKIPDRIVVTQQIPKTATGKVQRRHVKDALVKVAQEKTKAKL